MDCIKLGIVCAVFYSSIEYQYKNQSINNTSQ